MARIARVVVPNFPHHIVQRGNRKQKVFFRETDYQEYLVLLKSHIAAYNVQVLAYCLMPNHVHLIAVPDNEYGLAKAIGETHRKYTRMINFREKWRGYLWQGRFGSYVLDEQYLLAATRYILFNPVAAGIVKNPLDYKWSSARHHLKIECNPLIKDDLINGVITNWDAFIRQETNENKVMALRLHERTGRPLGDKNFIDRVERILARPLKKRKPGPRAAESNN
jgi:putative transposase